MWTSFICVQCRTRVVFGKDTPNKQKSAGLLIASGGRCLCRKVLAAEIEFYACKKTLGNCPFLNWAKRPPDMQITLDIGKSGVPLVLHFQVPRRSRGIVTPNANH